MGGDRQEKHLGNMKTENHHTTTTYKDLNLEYKTLAIRAREQNKNILDLTNVKNALNIIGKKILSREKLLCVFYLIFLFWVGLLFQL